MEQETKLTIYYKQYIEDKTDVEKKVSKAIQDFVDNNWGAGSIEIVIKLKDYPPTNSL